MRARYSAFAKAEVGFLLATGTHDSAPTLREWAQSVTWLGLQVLEHEAGGAADEAGTVRFVARYVESGKLIELAERSQFGKVAGQWRYLDGEPNVSTRELERNEPCPCGSGRKFKKCHA